MPTTTTSALIRERLESASQATREDAERRPQARGLLYHDV